MEQLEACCPLLLPGTCIHGTTSVSQTHLLHNHGQHKAKQYGPTARIRLAKLRSLHTTTIQSPRTMAIHLQITFAYFHVTRNTFLATLTNLSTQVGWGRDLLEICSGWNIICFIVIDPYFSHLCRLHIIMPQNEIRVQIHER